MRSIQVKVRNINNTLLPPLQSDPAVSTGKDTISAKVSDVVNAVIINNNNNNILVLDGGTF